MSQRCDDFNGFSSVLHTFPLLLHVQTGGCHGNSSTECFCGVCILCVYVCGFLRMAGEGGGGIETN